MADGGKNSGMLGGTAIRPIERKGIEAVKWFCYDQNTGAVMGRTPLSWLLIFIFYCVYYSCLAGFWALCMFVFFQTTIDYNVPRWTQDESLITRSPALGVRPGQEDKLLDSSMIIFNHAVPFSGKNGKDDPYKITGWDQWVNRTQEFLGDNYKNEGMSCTNANFVEEKKKQPNSFCKFDLKELKKCGKGNFGYNEGKPCILLKLNKIFDLVPDFYDDMDNVPNFPANKTVFPAELKEVVKNLPAAQRRQVWVDCHGENPADNENMGPVAYYPPSRGFHEKYFPFTNQPGYQSPLVAVQFTQPKKGILLHIECRAWAKNIGYNRRDRIGKAHFELLVHDKFTASKVDPQPEGTN
jgi:sodium/potassium-transporting ATPase subunit beta